LNTTLEGEGVRQSSAVAGAYPVSVEFPNLEYRNKFFAVPVLGMVVKLIMLLPFFLALYIVGIVVALAQLVLWVPVLFTGRYPSIGYTLVGGYLRWVARVGSFVFGLSDKYPSFSFDDELASGDPSVTFERRESANRLWAIPIVGILAKLICIVPHYIVLYALCYASLFFMMVSWVPVLFTGQSAKVPTGLYAGTIRWYVRVFSFIYGLTDQYPQFSLQ